MKKLSDEWLAQLPLTNIKSLKPVAGGDINDSYEVISDEGRLFLKVQPNRGKSFFAHEVEGIKLLSQAANVPTVIDYGEIEHDGFLLLAWIEIGTGNQYNLGQMAAQVHQIHQQKFGLDHNFTASKFPKINTWQTSWSKFFIEQRLEPLIKFAKEKGRWNQSREQHYQILRQQIIDYDKNHKIEPSLLHGDLWIGNAIFTANHQPMLIDPDVFYGDREFDIGITTVFGGFNNDFYRGYNDTYPLRPGFEKRVSWYQFYYALMHVYYFGENYESLLDGILGSFN
ncbi:fructosamine kinase family protein [Fructilactobacillus sanfranciscensis]|uniref:fructosamine kinase family protein n=1 Tax=Fructilactobacillus sanfranciscensis TaxID=1625 RepID=UPI001EF0DF5A|nr:fructosamine kinase family protein [Fructilactobacillus sanfranciscensis]MCG7193956.1 fructosamine kinase family protein [Fructilactobacillus sanfranciscensis]